MRNPTSPNGSTSIQNGSLCGGGANMAAPRRKPDPPLNLTCRLDISDFGAYLLINFHNGPLTPAGRIITPIHEAPRLAKRPRVSVNANSPPGGKISLFTFA